MRWRPACVAKVASPRMWRISRQNVVLPAVWPLSRPWKRRLSTPASVGAAQRMLSPRRRSRRRTTCSSPGRSSRRIQRRRTQTVGSERSSRGSGALGGGASNKLSWIPMARASFHELAEAGSRAGSFFTSPHASPPRVGRTATARSLKKQAERMRPGASFGSHVVSVPYKVTSMRLPFTPCSWWVCLAALSCLALARPPAGRRYSETIRRAGARGRRRRDGHRRNEHGHGLERR